MKKNIYSIALLSLCTLTSLYSEPHTFAENETNTKQYAQTGKSRLSARQLLLNNDTIENEDLSGIEVDAPEFDLSGVSFKGSTLKDARLDNSLIDFASFDEANLTDADLSGSSLKETTFKNASLKNADLSNTKHININNILQAEDITGLKLYNASKTRDGENDGSLTLSEIKELIQRGALVIEKEKPQDEDPAKQQMPK
jgi:hypothetical protein